MERRSAYQDDNGGIKIFFGSLLASIASVALALTLAIMVLVSIKNLDPAGVCSTLSDVPSQIFPREGNACKYTYLWAAPNTRDTADGDCVWLFGFSPNCFRLTTWEKRPPELVEAYPNGEPAGGTDWPWGSVSGITRPKPEPWWMVNLEVAACGDHVYNFPRRCWVAYTTRLKQGMVVITLLLWPGWAALFWYNGKKKL